MAFFDSARGCHVVRVVYDGPGLAGKTTNVQQVCSLIPAKKRSEMVTPGSLKGRTMFFDWLEIENPTRTRAQVRFQLITVPGQEQRNYRRRPLVEMADVVVFVCDCTPEQIPDTMRTFARLRVSMRRRESPLPLVVQANKQDVPEALAPDVIRRRLRLHAEVPVIAASAVKGVGVRKTLTTALELGTGSLKGVDGLDAAPIAEALGDADTLFDHVLTFEDAPNNDEPIDVEELHIAAVDLDLSADSVAGHLAASSMEALEAKARKASARALSTSSRRDAPVPEISEELEPTSKHGP